MKPQILLNIIVWALVAYLIYQRFFVGADALLPIY